MEKNNCDGCCYNNNPKKQLNCEKIVCCYIQKKRKTYACLINEKEGEII